MTQWTHRFALLAAAAAVATGTTAGLTAPAQAAGPGAQPSGSGKITVPDEREVGLRSMRSDGRRVAIGTEPTLPYAQPTDAALPQAGCDSTVTDPKAPPSSAVPAVQIVYAWNDASGNNYEALVEKVAKIVDRIDWSFDESSNYDQHIKVSCKSGSTGTYAQYARALVVAEKIEAPIVNGDADWPTIYNDLAAAGYDESNRWYMVFTDFNTPSVANNGCTTTGGFGCVGKVELWDSGVAGHEMLHLLGAGHAYMSEEVTQDSNGNFSSVHGFYPDIMMGWPDWWITDLGYRQNYDPSEPGATFFIDNYNSTTKRNIATHPLATTPVCCDEGANNDQLTAQERTVEAQAPGTANPTGFTFTGSGSMRVTPQGSYAGVSRKYFDGRRSLEATFNAQGTEASVAVTRRPAVLPNNQYKLFVRLRSDAPASTVLRLRWFTSGGSPISTASSTAFTPTGNWYEYRLTATAPSNAASVQVSVATPAGAGQPANGSFHLDTLQLTNCSANRNDVCRPEV